MADCRLESDETIRLVWGGGLNRADTIHHQINSPLRQILAISSNQLNLSYSLLDQTRCLCLHSLLLTCSILRFTQTPETVNKWCFGGLSTCVIPASPKLVVPTIIRMTRCPNNSVADYRVDSDGTIRVVWTVGIVLTQSEFLPTNNSDFSNKITINYSSN